ncbi:HI1506-related protein [Martelella alba]|uniref:Mu-like prophage FluMu N-terminal domain-containing protein n=1 Tax=Martelella alba TaxID=2590451 RepID=A0ABY2SR22_9HYPH|nr:HI1506-related protein [Martelella alba]TKI08660.1 hypothetical protein FCN80_01000 [Martelella alba]
MPVITITAKRDGFRRCGKAHSDKPVTWPDGSFTAEQIAILKAEPMLVVYDGEAPSDGDLQKQLDAVTADKATLQSQVDALTADKTALQSQVDELTAAAATATKASK